ncbi:MAG: alkaline shock response membrane anchor protein AmaP [Chloroflexota bacterium]|nr:alkaline shock response membrane anchor protein AmaP [Chloroflexota bacterium]
MNAVNRIVIVLVLIALAIFLPVAIIMPAPTIAALQNSLTAMLDSLTAVARAGEVEQMVFFLVRLVIAALVFLICLLFIFLEVRRPRKRTVAIQGADGKAELLTDSIASHLRYHVDQIPGVIKVKPRVISKGRSVRVEIHAETGPQVEVPAKAQEIRRVATEVAEQKLGLKLAREIKVTIKPAPYPKGRPPARTVPPTRPATPAPTPAPAPFQPIEFSPPAEEMPAEEE